MFLEALQIQARVILALMLREARTRYGRTQLGYFWALVEPLLHIGLFILLFRYLGRALALGDSVAMFLTTGFATFIGFRNVLGRTQGGYQSNAALLLFPPVKVLDVFVGRALLELATWVTVITILMSALIAFGSDLPRSIVLMATAIVSLFAIGFGVGTFLGVMQEFIPSLANILSIPFRLLYLFSGLFYLPETLPPLVRDYMVWNPVLHGVTLFRMGYYKYYDSFTFDGQYLAVWAIGSVFVALVTVRIGSKPLRSLS